MALLSPPPPPPPPALTIVMRCDANAFCDVLRCAAVLLCCGAAVVREGWPNHSMERYTTEIAKLMSDLCVVDGVAASYVVWNTKKCRPGDPLNLDPNYLTEQQYARSPFHAALCDFKAHNRADRYAARKRERDARAHRMASKRTTTASTQHRVAERVGGSLHHRNANTAATASTGPTPRS